jgi:hypothetical protein
VANGRTHMAHQYEWSECAFMVRSDDDEVIDHVRTHAQDAHGMQVADDDVRAGWETV